MAKNILGFIFVLALVSSTNACTPIPPTVEAGPLVQVEAGPVELEVGVDIDTQGNVILSGDFSLSTLGPIGAGLHVGIEKVLREAEREEAALFILWEDPSGEVWSEKYIIGQPCRVTFNDRQRVREIQSEGRNIIVALEPIGSVPDYDDLQSDIESLVKRWDRAHYNADHSWDTSDLPKVLRGAALKEQRDTVDWLKSKNCYWEIDELLTPEITYFERIGAQSLVVDVRKNWDMDICQDRREMSRNHRFKMSTFSRHSCPVGFVKLPVVPPFLPSPEAARVAPLCAFLSAGSSRL